MSKILVIGSINMDLMLHLDRLPSPGESMFGKNYAYGPGGKGANQAAAAAKLGADTELLCRVGNDEHGIKLRKSLKQNGVSDELVTIDDILPSGLAVIMLEESANRIAVFAGANMGLLPEHLLGALINKPDALMLQFELSFETVIAACAMAKEQGIMTVVDAGPACDFPLEKIACIDILSPNEPETKRLTGIYPDSDENIKKAAQILHKRAQPKLTILKLGNRGAAVYDGFSLKLYPSYPVKAVDTTAAGDAFTAALTIAMVEKMELESAIHFANAAGAMTVTRNGATPSLPNRYEVESFLMDKE